MLIRYEIWARGACIPVTYEGVVAGRRSAYISTFNLVSRHALVVMTAQKH